MSEDRIREGLIEAMRDIPVIDGHEHLSPEQKRVEAPVDFSVLFGDYGGADLRSAGMSADEYDAFQSRGELSPDEKWKVYEKYHPHVTHGSYARPGHIWIEKVLGLGELSASTYREISDRLQENNTPGIYDRVLRERCRIELGLLCRDGYDTYSDGDLALLRPLFVTRQPTRCNGVMQYCESLSGEKPTLDGYLEFVIGQLHTLEEKGMAGVKTVVFPGFDPDRTKAGREFDSLVERIAAPDADVDRADELPVSLKSVVEDRLFALAEEEDLTVAIHTGVWRDFRNHAPGHVIPLAQRYPNVSIDLFHLGMPYAREAVMVGKMFPRVSLNLCWCHIISPEMTVRALDEMLDMVPVNGVIAFGADYGLAVEKVYGHLEMAKENVARVLAKRIDLGRMDMDEALRIANLWFYENPKNIYGLT